MGEMINMLGILGGFVFVGTLWLGVVCWGIKQVAALLESKSK